METPEYKQLAHDYEMTSSPVKLKHGVLEFKASDDLFYYIDVHGNIRYRNVKTDRPGKLSTVPPDNDLYTRYMKCIELITNKLKRLENKPVTSFIIGKHPEFKDITSPSELDLTGITASINLSQLNLTDLMGLPTRLSGSLAVRHNKTALSLKGCPKRVGKNVDFQGCVSLLDIDQLPDVIGGDLNLAQTEVTSLAGIGKTYVKDCKLINLHSCIRLKSNILGLLLVKGLVEIIFSEWGEPGNYKKALKIINDELDGERDIMNAHEALTRAGLKDYAKL
jgi:hypothetical protein